MCFVFRAYFPLWYIMRSSKIFPEPAYFIHSKISYECSLGEPLSDSFKQFRFPGKHDFFRLFNSCNSG